MCLLGHIKLIRAKEIFLLSTGYIYYQEMSNLLTRFHIKITI